MTTIPESQGTFQPDEPLFGSLPNALPVDRLTRWHLLASWTRIISHGGASGARSPDSRPLSVGGIQPAARHSITSAIVWSLGLTMTTESSLTKNSCALIWGTFWPISGGNRCRLTPFGTKAPTDRDT